MRITERGLRALVREAVEQLRSGPPSGGFVKIPGRAIDWDAGDGTVSLEDLRPWIGRPFGPSDMPEKITSEPPEIGEDTEYEWQRWEDEGGSVFGVYENFSGGGILHVRIGKWPATIHPPKGGVVQMR